jgi:hypothetical protein
MLSRILYGSRVSLSIGLVGVVLSLVLGTLIGGASGFYGGFIDGAIQRMIEILRSFPSIPLWMALSAAVPATWSPLQVYFCMTVILALIGWTDLARVVRGKILSLREEDYALAARVAGVKDFSIIVRHLVPGFASHLIVSVTLAIPGMILAETALSFLRLGLRPPTLSWGRAPAGRAEHPRHLALSVAADAGRVRHIHGPDVQLPRRRPPRRRRPLQPMMKTVRSSTFAVVRWRWECRRAPRACSRVRGSTWNVECTTSNVERATPPVGQATREPSRRAHRLASVERTTSNVELRTFLPGLP